MNLLKEFRFAPLWPLPLTALVAACALGAMLLLQRRAWKAGRSMGTLLPRGLASLVLVGLLFNPDLAPTEMRLNGAPRSDRSLSAGASSGRPSSFRVTVRDPLLICEPGRPSLLSVEVGNPEAAPLPTRIELRRAGRLIAVRSMTLAAGGASILFPIEEARPGLTRYQVIGAASEGRRASDDFAAFARRARIRVLLLEGEPGWDAAFLARTLRADPAYSCDTLVGLAPGHPYALAGDRERSRVTLPRSVEAFAAYDLVVLGRGIGALLDAAAAEALKRWVTERGGGLIFLRGRDETLPLPLIDLQPMDYAPGVLARAHLALTPAGADLFSGAALSRSSLPPVQASPLDQPAHPSPASRQEQAGEKSALTPWQSGTGEEAPGLIDLPRVQNAKPTAVVLAAARETGTPLIALLRQGSGMTLAIAAQGLWRWELRPPEGGERTDLYRRFWSRLPPLLTAGSNFSPGQSVGLRADPDRASPGEPIALRVMRRQVGVDLPHEVRVIGPDGSIRRLPLSKGRSDGGDVTISFRPDRSGLYLATCAIPGSDPICAAVRVQNGAPGSRRGANGAPPKPNDITPPRSAGWAREWLLALLLGLITTDWIAQRGLKIKKRAA